MALNNFRAGDFNKREATVKTIHSTRDRVRWSEPQPTTKPVVQAGANPEDVPTGTTPEVLTWVGDNPVRAQKSLDLELENPKPRRGLVKQLNAAIEEESTQK